MSKNTRTTVLIPDNLLVKAKHWAVEENISFSQLVRDSLRDKLGLNQQGKPSILEAAGSISVDRQDVPSRKEIYEQRLTRNMVD